MEKMIKSVSVTTYTYILGMNSDIVTFLIQLVFHKICDIYSYIFIMIW